MELRSLILMLGFGAGLVQASPIKRYPLDDRAVYTVSVGTDAPTTILFPGALTALDGAGVSGQPEDAPSVLISHQPGAPFFSVRALKLGATAAVNVVYQDRVYALAFTAAGEVDRTVTFHDPANTLVAETKPRLSTERLISLLDRARHFALLAEQYPGVVQQVERSAPKSTHRSGVIEVTVDEVWRFGDEDALVFRLKLGNRTPLAVRYTPARLVVQVGETRFPAAITDGTGLLPAGRAAIVYLAIVGHPDGSVAALSLKNTFTVNVPVLE
ncbi:MAG: hypothetical protein JNJ82_04335 [Opitutaceae bacterium]|nr:hypothetical protein [Opitutaceae bacterium]